MPILMFGHYLLEVKASEEKQIASAITEQNWNLLGDYSLEDHVADLRREGLAISLYKIERNIVEVITDDMQDDLPEVE